MPKPKIGAHMSISGGYDKAVTAAADMGFDCVQLFSKNSNQWKGKSITAKEAELFKNTMSERKITDPLIHDSYLINLGSAKPDLYEKSLAAFADEVLRAETLGVPCVVMHPGTPTEDKSADPVESGLKRIADALNAVFTEVGNNNKVTVLLETTAGQGSNLGWRFEHLAKIIELSKFPERLAVCVDTCHIFAAGYSILDEKSYENTFAEFDRIIGVDRLRAFHLNDSVKGLGCRVDRHAHIGHGEIGAKPFGFILNDPRFVAIPMYLETPKGTTEINGQTADWDAVNLSILRNLVK
ncbi:MAG: deoxyribonuclease IV [Thermoguttaceae bacterium]